MIKTISDDGNVIQVSNFQAFCEAFLQCLSLVPGQMLFDVLHFQKQAHKMLIYVQGLHAT